MGMHRLIDAGEAEVLLTSYGCWFGPPVLILRKHRVSHILDGRIRTAAWEALRMPGKPPRHQCHNDRDAAGLLLLAGHPERARGALGPGFDFGATPVQLATMLKVPVGYACELKSLATGSRGQGARTDLDHPKALRRQRTRTDVVQRLRTLYRDSLENVAPITPEDLRRALGEWL